MDLITALAVVIGIMGGIATAVAVQIGSVFWAIWVTFVGWASFYAAGGDDAAVGKSIAANIWGAIIATASLWAFMEMSPFNADGTANGASWKAGVAVGVAIIVLILGAKIPALGFIPGHVFGYAPTAGLFLTSFALLDASWVKLLLASVISLVIGNILGIVSAKIGGAVAKS